MSKPTIRIHNVETDKVIDREMTNDEFAQYQIDQESQAVAEAQTQEKIQTKAALLDRLGITEDEAKLLLA